MKKFIGLSLVGLMLVILSGSVFALSVIQTPDSSLKSIRYPFQFSPVTPSDTSLVGRVVVRF
jgi:hypothetical protein